MPAKRQEMRNFAGNLLLSLIFVGMTPFICLAELDELQIRLLEQFELPLRWDNIEGTSQWVSGSEPSFDRKEAMHMVRLEPGETVTVKLPPRAMLRAFNPNGVLESNDLEMWLSNGSGAYVRFPTTPSSDNRSILILPDNEDAMVARVSRPVSHSEAVDVALFTSRYEPLGEIAPYRSVIKISAPVLGVRLDDEAAATNFWSITEDVPIKVEIKGPTRIKVETRLQYPETEARAFQNYKVYVSLDGAMYQILEFETNVESRHRVFVDGNEKVVGQLKVDYIEVPEGKQKLLIDSTAQIYIRLLQSEQPDYLLPKFNQPRLSAEQVQEEGTPPILKSSIWKLTGEEAKIIAAKGKNAAAEKEHLSLRLARDNMRREGGILGSTLMREAGSEFPDYPLVRDVAEDLFSSHTYYRNLWPVEKLIEEAQRMAWFAHRRLLAPAESTQDVIISQQHINDSIDLLSNGFFVKLPEGEDSALLYRLPERFGPSQLRIVVENNLSGGERELMVQFDRQPAIRVLISSEPELPVDQYQLSRAEAGLAALRWEYQKIDEGTIGGPFSRFHIPGPLLDVSTAELQLSPKVRELRVWATGRKQINTMIAVQYRVARPFQLSELEYLDMLQRAGKEQKTGSLLFSILRDELAPDAYDSDAVRELSNHWLPMMRLLRSEQKLLLSTLVPPRLSKPDSPTPRERKANDLLVDRAERLEIEGQWLAALETWNQLLNSGKGKYRRRALFGRTAALQGLGEEFLAEKQLQGILIYEPDEGVRREALERLAQIYSQTSATEELLTLYAVASIQSPSANVLSSLADALLQNGEYEMALMAGLEISEGERPLTTMIRAAYQIGWWQVFENLIDNLPTSEEKHFWKAARSVSLGNHQDALSLFQQAGPDGKTMANNIESALAIHSGLSAPDIGTRARAVLDWENWEANQPDLLRWREDPSLVRDYLGTNTTYSVDRNLFTQYFRGNQKRPVKLEVLGPVLLKLEARPLHNQGLSSPVDGWLNIEEQTQFHAVAINSNWPSRGLELVGDDTLIPGTEITTELALGPGLHEINISSPGMDVLVRVFTKQPEIPLGILPPLSRNTLTAVLTGEFGRASGKTQQPRISPQKVRIIKTNNGSTVVPSTLAGAGLYDHIPRGFLKSNLAALDPALAARLALRTGENLDPYAHAFVGESGTMPAEEVVIGLARLGKLSGTCSKALKETLKVSTEFLEAVCVAEGDLEGAVEMQIEDGDDAVRRRMTLLLKMAEENPNLRVRAQILGEALFAAHPRVNGLQSLHARLMRGSTWAPVTSVQQSAGLRNIEVNGWEPESPALRTRKALLAQTNPEDQILFGYNELGVSFFNLEPTLLELDLAMANLEYLPPGSLTAVYQVDQGMEEKLILTPELPSQPALLPLPVGEHTVRVWIDQPLANQFLRVRMNELISGGVGEAQKTKHMNVLPIVKTSERAYNIATDAEPIRFTLKGPAWVRIDELREEMMLSHYRLLPDGWQTIELRPEPGIEEALFRFYQRAPAPGERLVFPLRVKVEREPVHPPFIELESAIMPEVAGLVDAYELGKQEDGTWSVSSLIVRRRVLEEKGGGNPDQFAELHATYRYFYKDWGSYFETTPILRLRTDAGSSYGVMERIFYSPDWAPVNFHFDGGFYLQQPNGTVVPENKATEWSLLLRGTVNQFRRIGPKTAHLPSLSLFGNILSLKENNKFDDIDQDVFTQYKADHPFGLAIADTLIHKPWLDTEWWARVSLASNKEIILDKPDYLSFRGGWKQLINEVQVDAAYLIARFFSDDDRDSGFTRNSVFLDLTWDLWLKNKHHLELGFDLRYDFGDNQISGAAFLTFYFDQGRAYVDFRPDEVDFPELRERSAAQLINDRIIGLEQ